MCAPRSIFLGISLLIALFASLFASSLLAVNQVKFDLIVSKLETVMEEKDIDSTSMVRALKKLKTKQANAERRELVEAVEEYFADPEARIAWLKNHKRVTVISYSDKKETIAAEESEKKAETSTGNVTASAQVSTKEKGLVCPSKTHASKSGNSCEDDLQSCYRENGAGQTQWDHAKEAWGTCMITACNEGYKLSDDSTSCVSNAKKFPGCDTADKLLGGLFWAMCDSTGSQYKNYYFSIMDSGRACPSGYRVPTADEWHDAYVEVRGTGTGYSTEAIWKYNLKLADTLGLSARGNLSPGDAYSLRSNSFSLIAPPEVTVDYGDTPEKYRSNISVPVVHDLGLQYYYLASDGYFSVAATYDTENPLNAYQFKQWDDDVSNHQALIIPVRCVRSDE